MSIKELLMRLILNSTSLILMYLVASFIKWNVEWVNEMPTYDPAIRGLILLGIIVNILVTQLVIYEEFFKIKKKSKK